MAETPNTEERLRRLRTLVGAGQVSGLATMPLSAQQAYIDQMIFGGLDANVRPQRDFEFVLANPTYEETDTLYRDGARTALFTDIDSLVAGTASLDRDTVLSYEALLDQTGYQPALDESLSAAEVESLVALRTAMEEGRPVAEIAGGNFEAIATAEAAAADVQALQDQSISALRLAGYLPDEYLSHENGPAAALRMMINDSVGPSQQVAEMNRAFQDGQITDYGRQFILEHAIITNDQLLAFADSGDPDRIAAIQHYANATGGADIPAEAIGYMTPDTRDYVQGQLRAPLETPSGLFSADGSLNPSYAINHASELYLPIDDLSASDRALYDAMSDPNDQAIFAAGRLLTDRASYEAALTEENARRANIQWDSEVELPVVAVPEEATIIEEQFEIAQNPAALALNSTGDAVIDAAQPIVDSIEEHGVGVTDRSGFVVFNGQDVALSGIVDALKSDNGAFGGGLQEGHMRLNEALNMINGSVAADDMGASPFMDPTISTSPDDANAVLASLGYDRNHEFNLADPVEMRALMQGIVIDRTIRNSDMPIFSEERVQEVADTVLTDRVNGAIDRAISGEPEEEAPAQPYEASSPRLMSHFHDARDGVVIARTDPAMAPPAPANTPRAPGLDMAG